MKMLRNLFRGNNQVRWTGPPDTTASCSLPSLTQFWSQFVATAVENPEGVGYATFMAQGQPCGVEVYCAPLWEFYSCVSIDQKAVRIDANTLADLMDGLATDGEIDDIRVEWHIRFYTPDPVPEALLRILRFVCKCPEDAQLEIAQWWT